MSVSLSDSNEKLDRIERMRTKAVYRSMLKVIDTTFIDIETTEYSEQNGSCDIEATTLYKNTRCMSGAEFELAVEERILAGRCGYPGCEIVLEKNQSKVNSKDCPHGYCSLECHERVNRFVAKLGPTDEAVKRFTTLYKLAKKEMNTRLGSQGDDGIAKTKKEDVLAAGSRKAPIMHAVVKERNLRPSGDTQNLTMHPSKQQSYDHTVIDGYTLSSKKTDTQILKQKKVHFADTVDGTASITTQDNRREEEQNQGGPAKFVFNIEDPKGPIDDDLKSLADTFGTLTVVRDDTTNDEGSEETPTLQQQGVDQELVRTMRKGASKFFPHLESCFPKELWESSLGASDGSVDDDDDDDDISFLGEAELESSDDDVPIKCHKTFFTQLFSFFDIWITDYTIEIISGRKRSSTNEERKTVPQVPEVMTAMQRFVSIACKSLTTSLKAEHDTKSIGESISNIIYSFRMDQSLPAFHSKQWVVVCLVILKALSLSAHPEYQEYTDTRDGIVRVGKILSDASFTVEEFYAVLDLFVPDLKTS